VFRSNLFPAYGVTQTFAYDHGSHPHRIFGRRWMDTITSGPLGPRSERPIKVLRCPVGRKDPAPPRHEARRPRLPEVGPKAACGVAGLKLLHEPSNPSTLRCDTSTSSFGRHIPQHTCRFHICNAATIRRVSGSAVPHPSSNGPLRLEHLPHHLTTSRTPSFLSSFTLPNRHDIPPLHL